MGKKIQQFARRTLWSGCRRVTDFCALESRVVPLSYFLTRSAAPRLCLHYYYYYPWSLFGLWVSLSQRSASPRIFQTEKFTSRGTRQLAIYSHALTTFPSSILFFVYQLPTSALWPISLSQACFFISLLHFNPDPVNRLAFSSTQCEENHGSHE